MPAGRKSDIKRILKEVGGEHSITTEDGRVRPKHVLIEFKK
jgi:hypothetical protein